MEAPGDRACSSLGVDFVFSGRPFTERIIQAGVSIKTAFIVQIVALVVEHAEFFKKCVIIPCKHTIAM